MIFLLVTSLSMFSCIFWRTSFCHTFQSRVLAVSLWRGLAHAPAMSCCSDLRHLARHRDCWCGNQGWWWCLPITTSYIIIIYITTIVINNKWWWGGGAEMWLFYVIFCQWMDKTPGQRSQRVGLWSWWSGGLFFFRAKNPSVFFFAKLMGIWEFLRGRGSW